MENCFIITSHGWSGSNWLAHVLNLNPDIICTHSAKNILAKKTDVHSNQNLKKDIQKLHQGYLNRQTVNIEETYKYILEQGKAKLYGSVHVYRLRDLPVLNSKFGTPRHSFIVKNLIRNPINLIWSGFGQFKDLFLYDLNEMYWTLNKIIENSKEFIHNIGNKYNIKIGEIDNLAFIGACSVLSSLNLDKEAEIEMSKIPYINFIGHVKMEQITKDPNELNTLILELGKGKVYNNQEYLDRIYQIGNINKHKKDNRKLTPEGRYNEFLPWQKEVFLYYMNKFDLINYYQAIGYDLKFLSSN